MALREDLLQHLLEAERRGVDVFMRRDGISCAHSQPEGEAVGGARAVGHWLMAGSGVGELVCKLRRRHVLGPLEQRWPELGVTGWIRQCPRCLQIRAALPPKEVVDALVRRWLAQEHDVFREGCPVGKTRLRAEAVDAVLALRMDVFQNWRASEPRWDAIARSAIAGDAYAAADDPNDAILKCARRARGEEPSPRWDA